MIKVARLLSLRRLYLATSASSFFFAVLLSFFFFPDVEGPALGIAKTVEKSLTDTAELDAVYADSAVSNADCVFDVLAGLDAHVVASRIVDAMREMMTIVFPRPMSSAKMAPRF